MHFENNQFDGFGILYNKVNGDYFFGYFYDSCLINGDYHYKDGTIYSGGFKNGKRIPFSNRKTPLPNKRIDDAQLF